MSDPSPSDAPPDFGTGAFLRALRLLLRPLTRVLIARGVTLPMFNRLMKQVYVETAERHFRLGDAPPTDSRVSVLTGVHRRDVRALRENPDGAADAARGEAALLATVVGRWLAGTGARGPDGAPPPLPRVAETGPSFEALVREVSRDVRPRTVLDELIRQGVVREDAATGLLMLDPAAIVGPGDRDRRLAFFAANLGDHVATAAENLLREEGGRLERAVFYNRLTPASVAEIEAEAGRLARDALLRLNDLARARQIGDESAPDATSRFRFGVYFYDEDERCDPPSSPSSA